MAVSLSSAQALYQGIGAQQAAEVLSRLNGTMPDAQTFSGGVTVSSGGVSVTGGGIAVSSGGVSVTSGSLTTTEGVTSGTARRVGGGAFRQVAASTAITGATETQANFDQTYTMPANTLAVGTRVKIRAQGIHTLTTDTEDHTILLVMGSTVLCSKAAVDPANSDCFFFDFEIVCRTAGSSGTFVGCGLIATGPSGTADVTAVFKASTSVDTTAAQIFAVAVDRQASATDTDSARLDMLVVDIIG